jgi:hypothetical protein
LERVVSAIDAKRSARGGTQGHDTPNAKVESHVLEVNKVLNPLDYSFSIFLMFDLGFAGTTGR